MQNEVVVVFSVRGWTMPLRNKTAIKVLMYVPNIKV